MSLSIQDVFRIGIGPSSSHTVGPMRAAKRFIDGITTDFDRIQIKLLGSLGATGRGHGTDSAVILGLLGYEPELVDADARRAVASALSAGILPIKDSEITFVPAQDLLFLGAESLPRHPNAMIFTADSNGTTVHREIYYSIGGGEILAEDEELTSKDIRVPYPFITMNDLIARCDETGLSIAQLIRENEVAINPNIEVSQLLQNYWRVMDNAIKRGLHTEGYLPGGLKVKRRAPDLYRKLSAEQQSPDPLRGLDWITMAAFAVSEENAAGGQLVTAPTNGAAGVIPAVIYYYQNFIPNAHLEGIERILLTAAAVGMIFKQTASISGAEVGCQGEIGTACAMAAAGLAAVLGGSVAQIENAAEIALEHNLGLTCDPIAGLVQVPCIERNGIGAVKAITAARTALRGDGRHLVSLDSVAATMMATGRDMSNKYKETSMGGLALSLPQC